MHPYHREVDPTEDEDREIEVVKKLLGYIKADDTIYRPLMMLKDSFSEEKDFYRYLLTSNQQLLGTYALVLSAARSKSLVNNVNYYQELTEEEKGLVKKIPEVLKPVKKSVNRPSVVAMRAEGVKTGDRYPKRLLNMTPSNYIYPVTTKTADHDDWEVWSYIQSLVQEYAVAATDTSEPTKAYTESSTWYDDTVHSYFKTKPAMMTYRFPKTSFVMQVLMGVNHGRMSEGTISLHMSNFPEADKVLITLYRDPEVPPRIELIKNEKVRLLKTGTNTGVSIYRCFTTAFNWAQISLQPELLHLREPVHQLLEWVNDQRESWRTKTKNLKDTLLCLAVAKSRKFFIEADRAILNDDTYGPELCDLLRDVNVTVVLEMLGLEKGFSPACVNHDQAAHTLQTRHDEFKQLSARIREWTTNHYKPWHESTSLFYTGEDYALTKHPLTDVFHRQTASLLAVRGFEIGDLIGSMARNARIANSEWHQRWRGWAAELVEHIDVNLVPPSEMIALLRLMGAPSADHYTLFSCMPNILGRARLPKVISYNPEYTMTDCTKDTKVAGSRAETQDLISVIMKNNLQDVKLIDFVKDRMLKLPTPRMALRIKENEMNADGRLFAAADAYTRFVWVFLEKFMAESILPHCPEVSVGDTMQQTLSKLRSIYTMMGTDKLVNNIADFKKFCTSLNSDNTYLFASSLDQLSDLPTTFVEGMSYFAASDCMFFKTRVNLYGSIEGLMQKFWTWMVKCISKHVARTLLQTYTALLAGDNQNIATGSKTSTTDEEAYENALVYKSRYEEVLASLGMRLKLSETYTTDKLMYYGKSAVVEDSIVQHRLKRLIGVCIDGDMESLCPVSQMANLMSSAVTLQLECKRLTTAHNVYKNWLWLMADNWKELFKDKADQLYTKFLVSFSDFNGYPGYHVPIQYVRGDRDRVSTSFNFARMLVAAGFDESLFNVIPPSEGIRALKVLLEDPYATPFRRVEAVDGALEELAMEIPDLRSSIPRLVIEAKERKELFLAELELGCKKAKKINMKGLSYIISQIKDSTDDKQYKKIIKSNMIRAQAKNHLTGMKPIEKKDDYMAMFSELIDELGGNNEFVDLTSKYQDKLNHSYARLIKTHTQVFDHGTCIFELIAIWLTPYTAAVLIRRYWGFDVEGVTEDDPCDGLELTFTEQSIDSQTLTVFKRPSNNVHSYMGSNTRHLLSFSLDSTQTMKEKDERRAMALLNMYTLSDSKETKQTILQILNLDEKDLPDLFRKGGQSGGKFGHRLHVTTGETTTAFHSNIFKDHEIITITLSGLSKLGHNDIDKNFTRDFLYCMTSAYQREEVSCYYTYRESSDNMPRWSSISNVLSDVALSIPKGTVDLGSRLDVKLMVTNFKEDNGQSGSFTLGYFWLEIPAPKNMSVLKEIQPNRFAHGFYWYLKQRYSDIKIFSTRIMADIKKICLMYNLVCQYDRFLDHFSVYGYFQMKEFPLSVATRSEMLRRWLIVTLLSIQQAMTDNSTQIASSMRDFAIIKCLNNMYHRSMPSLLVRKGKAHPLKTDHTLFSDINNLLERNDNKDYPTFSYPVEAEVGFDRWVVLYRLSKRIFSDKWMEALELAPSLPDIQGYAIFSFGDGTGGLTRLIYPHTQADIYFYTLMLRNGRSSVSRENLRLPGVPRTALRNMAGLISQSYDFDSTKLWSDIIKVIRRTSQPGRRVFIFDAETANEVKNSEFWNAFCLVLEECKVTEESTDVVIAKPYCKKPTIPDALTELDHLVPLKKYGQYYVKNLQVDDVPDTISVNLYDVVCTLDSVAQTYGTAALSPLGQYDRPIDLVSRSLMMHGMSWSEMVSRNKVFILMKTIQLWMTISLMNLISLCHKVGSETYKERLQRICRSRTVVSLSSIMHMKPEKLSSLLISIHDQKNRTGSIDLKVGVTSSGFAVHYQEKQKGGKGAAKRAKGSVEQLMTIKLYNDHKIFNLIPSLVYNLNQGLSTYQSLQMTLEKGEKIEMRADLMMGDMTSVTDLRPSAEESLLMELNQLTSQSEYDANMLVLSKGYADELQLATEGDAVVDIGAVEAAVHKAVMQLNEDQVQSVEQFYTIAVETLVSSDLDDYIDHPHMAEKLEPILRIFHNTGISRVDLEQKISEMALALTSEDMEAFKSKPEARPTIVRVVDDVINLGDMDDEMMDDAGPQVQSAAIEDQAPDIDPDDQSDDWGAYDRESEGRRLRRRFVREYLIGLDLEDYLDPLLVRLDIPFSTRMHGDYPEPVVNYESYSLLSDFLINAMGLVMVRGSWSVAVMGLYVAFSECGSDLAIREHMYELITDQAAKDAYVAASMRPGFVDVWCNLYIVLRDFEREAEEMIED